ncbi:restriction endonuclease subunit S [Candidatus Falkowbacteria bacterium]|nr:restriction endonuclease subunit S [Candidatus Falkowbacteria bacterium]
MNNNWQKVKLGEVIDINAKSVERNYHHKEIKYVDISSVGTGELLTTTTYLLTEAPGRAKRLVSDGDTILSTVRPNRRSFYFVKDPKDNLVVSTGFAVLTPKYKKMDPRFLYYFVTRQQFSDYLTANTMGSAYPAVNINVIADAEIIIPEYTDQHRIASILSAFDDKIELNNKINQTLEQMAQAIFKEWFGTSQKSKGWEKTANLESTCDIVYGKDLPTKNFKKQGFPVYGGNGIIGYSDKYLYNEPQIIVGCRGAYSGNIFKTEPKSFVTHNSLVLRIKKQQSVGINYLLYVLEKSNVRSTVTGSAQPQITITELNKLQVQIPDRELAKQFEKEIGVIEDYKFKNYKENKKLASLRDLLLPKLMSGEVGIEA